MSNFDFSIIRKLRQRDKLSIAELSEESGVSAAVISKLERNCNHAELDTLLRLARVFELSTAELLSMAELNFTRRCNETFRRAENFRFREVHFPGVKVQYGRADAGDCLSRPEIHRDEYEMCWVLKGKMKLSLSGTEYEVSVGMSLAFDALLEHGYCAIEDSEFIIIHRRKDQDWSN